ncbi:diglucosyl diacylglycerol synthase [Aneurinibacillus terranovensis]|uniref:diglucosyl diacylglycerol synthase n=1 Tax=Aneurinibacillus terranovensis TaxID=278991 RepID=UPI00041E1F6D|nr:diglucosyl diacylglycerol synthase [Aneurinibacillus terranovensis]
MNRDIKVLILFASYGDGHIQVSRVLQKSFLDSGISRVILKDLFAESHPFINALTRYLYIKSFSFAPFLYGWMYHRTKEMQHETRITQWFNSFGIRKLRYIIREEQPDVVINTFPMLVMPELRKRDGVFIPTYTVVTDFVLHNRWIHPQIDKFYVPTDDVKRKMMMKGIPADRIKVSGIPIRKGFETGQSPSDAYQKYGLDPSRKQILVMAGAYGVVQNLEKICRSFSLIPDLQMILVCGRNRSLQEEMEHHFAGNPCVRVLGFVENIHELMGVASCIVTKAGGITLSEAIAQSLPIIIFRPVPGQEMENARYLNKKGAAIIVNNTGELVREIGQLLDHKQHLNNMKEAVRALYRQRASSTIIEDILDSLDTNNKSYINKVAIRGIYGEHFQ